MTNTIPQSIIDQIQEKYPVKYDAGDGIYLDDHNVELKREAAQFGYGLGEAIIKELEERVNELTQDNMTHEYNQAEAIRTWPQFKEQIIEEYKASIEGQSSTTK